MNPRVTPNKSLSAKKDPPPETASSVRIGRDAGFGTGPVKRVPKGNLIVITGPSGVGKGTVVQKLLEEVPRLTKSVSVTTRAMRPGEKEGVDYTFVTDEKFAEMLENGAFMEWAEYSGNFYGTPHTWVEEQLRVKKNEDGVDMPGKDVILEIEVDGAKQIRDRFSQAVLIFLSPPSFDELKSRLKGRGTESAAKIQLRLHKARQEMRERGLFHYEVVNDNVDEAVKNLLHVVYAERCRIRETKAPGASNEHY
ncbi:MAG: guanylate kinase [Cyanobacteria bacterium SZAS-4]|nr:guanylate kinase [Cyanobacteria bacterium SZAS-4]